jgi:chromosomal replication initiation ATPase DnaA
MSNQELLVANFTNSKNKLSKIIDDDKFNEAIKKELVYIKNINNDIYAKINNEYIANEFINNYLKNFEDIFNQLCGENFSIHINASEQEPVYSKTFKVNLEHTGINKDQTFDNIVECKFNEEAITYAKKIIKNNK